MVNVLADEVDDGLHRVVVGLEVEVQSATDKVLSAVGEVKLHRGGHALAVHLDEKTVDAMFVVDNQTVAHTVGLLQVLGDHGVNVFQIFSQIAVYGLVGQVDGAFELRHLNVDPVFLVGRIAIVCDEGVFGALEAVFFNRVDFDVGLFGQVDAEIATRLGQWIGLAVTGEGYDESDCSNDCYG